MKKSLINAINSISSTEEMNQAITLINAKQKQLRSLKARSVKSTLSVGSKVKVNGSRNGVQFGEVTKINRTKAVVRIDGHLWNCPLTIIEAA
tara:strand:- start:15397 stop:15672 length:276 start_codon:yes stop_codon:yes gene_type:complete